MGVVKQLKHAAGVPDMDVEATIADFRTTMIEVATGIDDLRAWLQVLVLIQAAIAEHAGVPLETGVRELIASMVIER